MNQEIMNLFNPTTPAQVFDQIRISIASPEKILSWSYGEIKKPETINYRTFKPERDGLFCARIFGPIKDYECLCGKYKRMKYKGIICEKCSVEVTLSRVRRERMGHIELAAPVAHIWFLKSLPSRIGLLLDMTLKDLERILYFEYYVVLEPGLTALKDRQLLSEDEYLKAQDEYGQDSFTAMIGAEAIREMAKALDLEKMAADLRQEIIESTSELKPKKLAKRLKLIEAFTQSSNKPEWMILTHVPVIPPDLRPLVPLDGGRFATSDLNDLYRPVINRNNRLKRLIELRAPDIIIRNEKRMLQEAVDALFDNGRRGRVITGANKRPLKSLADMLKGKQGRFRQNLLGKRVDYSGRSVIVVGPELKLHQCGLPKKMALELFKPFIYHRLEQTGNCTTINQAKEMVKQQDPIVWDILEEVIREHPVLLNRAPTPRGLGIQRVDPALVALKAIRIQPLVCTAVNADFDGDQMAVHITQSPEAEVEASVLMLSSHNILSPANGYPLAVPTQDMVLGVYFMTKSKPKAKGEGRAFGSSDECVMALEGAEVELLTPIRMRYTGEVIDLTNAYDDQDVPQTEPVNLNRQFLHTTVGRVIFNDHLPTEMPFVTGLLKKKGVQALGQYCFLRFGLEKTVVALDKLKELGFLYATKSGVSIGISDMVIPSVKFKLVDAAEHEVVKVQQQYLDGAITNGERYNKVIAIWSDVTEKVADEMFKALEEQDKQGIINPVYVMADSGARGSKQQIRQLSGMRGLMAKPSGEVIETPITSNFREGLTVLQYFISTHGARKGLADTALKTADSGYLTRRLVDVAQDVIINEFDCGTADGIYVEPILEAGVEVESLRDRVIGRVSLEKIKDYEGSVIVEINQEITEELANAIQAAGIERVKIRSVLTCESRRGVCARCYGRNLATGRFVEMGEAVGVIAAQSIGEPGTQLTMRTFHIGGTATRVTEQSKVEARNNGFVKFIDLNVVEGRNKTMVAMNRSGLIAGVDEKNREKERHPVVYGARFKVEDGHPVTLGQTMVEWDPYTFSILTETGGSIQFKDLQPGITIEEQGHEATGLPQVGRRLPPGDENNQPTILVRDPQGRVRKKYLMPSRAHLMVADGDEVQPGDVLAKIPRETTKTKDITGGLPRVVELFETRKPKDPAVISEIDGIVKYGDIVKGQRKIFVESEDGRTLKEYSVSRGVHINVQEGEHVRAGEPLIDGPLNPHDILAVLGEKYTQAYLVNSIQEVYRLQGVNINDKHIETIVRQMMRWVKVEDVGDTTFLLEEQIDKFRFREENDRVIREGGRPATGRPLLLGITKASLSTDSFISAASFQETTRVLTEAAISGKVDYLRGLKENVIMGRLIPAGTGLERYRNIDLLVEVPPPPPPEIESPAPELTAEEAAALDFLRKDADDVIAESLRFRNRSTLKRCIGLKHCIA